MGLEKNDEFKFRTGMLWLLIAVPFLGPYLYFVNFEIAGTTIDVFRAVLGISFVICIVKAVQKKWEIPQVKGTAGLFVLFLVLAFALATVNIMRQGILAGELTEMMALLYTIIYTVCLALIIGKDAELWEKIQSMLIAVGAAVTVLAYAEVLTGFCLPSSRYNNMEYLPGYSAHPATSIYANENNLAAFFLIICTVIIMKIIKEPNKKKCILMYIEFTAILILLTLSDSTIYKLGVIIEIIAALIFYVHIKKKDKTVFAKCGIIIGLIVGLLVLLKTFFRKALMLGNILITCGWQEMISVDISDKLAQGDALMAQLSNTGMGTVTIRKNLFLYGSEAAADNPVTGHGADSFSRVIGLNDAWLAGTGEIVDPHNFLVELVVQYGILLLILFLIICVVVFIGSLKGIWKGNAPEKQRYCDVTMLLIAFAIMSVMPSSFIKYTVYFIPFVVVVTGFDLIRAMEKHKEIA